MAQALQQQLRTTDIGYRVCVCCHVLPALSILQLHAAYSGNVTMQGYLLKHRPVTQLMGLFAQEWEMRCACAVCVWGGVGGAGTT